MTDSTSVSTLQRTSNCKNKKRKRRSEIARLIFIVAIADWQFAIAVEQVKCGMWNVECGIAVALLYDQHIGKSGVSAHR